VLEAQKVKKDTASQSFATKYFPTGIRFGTDAFALVRNTYDETFKGWELNADVDFYRYYLTVDYGYWGRNFEGSGNVYDNDGTYFRAGVDVNFLTKDPDRNMFFVGARYGRSTFSENLVVETIDPVWGAFSTSYSNSKINGNWAELTTGIRVKMWNFFWLGYTCRYKFALTTNETGDMIPHDVPGYGRTNKNSTWGFNYQVFFRIPVRKQPPLTPKK
jgi:hypothetical protein